MVYLCLKRCAMSKFFILGILLILSVSAVKAETPLELQAYSAMTEKAAKKPFHFKKFLCRVLKAPLVLTGAACSGFAYMPPYPYYGGGYNDFSYGVSNFGYNSYDYSPAYGPSVSRVGFY